MKLHFISAGLLLAGVVSCLPSIDRDEVCEGKVDGYHCASCKQPVYCNATLSTPATVLPSCGRHSVCQEFSPTIAGCTQESNSLNCTCSNSNNVCDPFSDAYLDICISTSIDDVQDCGDGGACHFDQCVDRLSCTDVPDGSCVHDPHYCNLGYVCMDGMVEEERQCLFSAYVAEDCACELPTEPCADFCAGDCPDVINCHQYYVCDGLGQVLSGPIVCPSDSDYYYFNPSSNPPACGESSTHCSSVSFCGFARY